MTVTRHELDWYVARLERGEPTVSLLYGDGEFTAASRDRVGCRLQNDEVATESLCSELRRSLLPRHDGPDLVRASDPFVLDWTTYGGRDVAFVRDVSERAQGVLREVRPAGGFIHKVVGGAREPDPGIDWADGRVWDEAVRDGRLGPLVRWLRANEVLVVGCEVLSGPSPVWGPRTHFVSVPPSDAAARLDETWDAVRKRGRFAAWVLCCGLSAVPLAMRLRKGFPGATVLDLGSTFDVFYGLGAERGWRQELYADPRALAECVRKNLEGAQ